MLLLLLEVSTAVASALHSCCLNSALQHPKLTL
jgi:hypothetical protein